MSDELPSTEPDCCPPLYSDQWLNPATQKREADAWRHQYHEARTALAEAQAEVERLRAKLDEANDGLEWFKCFSQASPPACEGERVETCPYCECPDYGKTYHETYRCRSCAMEWKPGEAMEPAAPKPAADEQLSPANEKFLNEMLAKPAAGGELKSFLDYSPNCEFCGQPTMHAGNTCFTCTKNEHNRNRRLELERELAAANQRADAAEEAFRNAQTALVQTGRQLGQAEKLLRKVNSIGFTGPLADEIRSFLTPKESGDESEQVPVPVESCERGAVLDSGGSPGLPDSQPAGEDSQGHEQPAQALPADDGERVKRLAEKFQLWWETGYGCLTWPNDAERAGEMFSIFAKELLAAQSAELDELRADRDILDFLEREKRSLKCSGIGYWVLSEPGVRVNWVRDTIREVVSAAKEDKRG